MSSCSLHGTRRIYLCFHQALLVVCALLSLKNIVAINHAISVVELNEALYAKKGSDYLGKASVERYLNSAILPPIVFLKTHKTGGTTVTNIVQRWADLRGLNVMIPKLDFVSLGYDQDFPGKKNAQYYAFHSIDVICNHAILNKTIMDQFMRKPSIYQTTQARSVSSADEFSVGSKQQKYAKPFYFTVLRNPVAQTISSFNWFKRRFDIPVEALALLLVLFFSH